MPYTPIIGTLGYVLAADNQTVLLIHRNARANDQHLGKYNGLGGKLEPAEDVCTGMTREIHEEAGIEVRRMRLRGTVNWPGFGPNGEDWLCFVFLVDGWSGQPISKNSEGELEWVPTARLLDACSPDREVRSQAALPMWPGDLHFVPLVFDGDARSFHGVMPYKDGQPMGWSFARI